MCASLRFLRAGPPPPRVALLSDAVFFTHVLPVVPTATAAEVAAQVELALETLSPFPVTQLYHGYYWKPGLAKAFVFAAYRRRFTAEQTQEWPRAQLVIPVFASVFGATVSPATTIVLTSLEGLTAVHWETPDAPSRVLFQAFPEEASDEDRQRVREELLRNLGGSKQVIDLPIPPMPESSSDDDEIVLSAGTFASSLPVALTSGLDVRDKIQLAELRRAQLRDVWLWRTVLASAAALVLLACGSLALWGTNRFWQTPRLAKVKAQASLVEKIDSTQKLANRIEELTTKRLLPLEMIDLARKKPDSVQWTSVVTSGLQTLIIRAQTTNANDVSAYQAALRALPECERAETSESRLSNGVTTFTLTVTFKLEALKAETS